MIRKVYIDTSVVGGCFDEEFELWTKLFFDSVVAGRFKIATSELLYAELLNAPEQVKQYLMSIPDEHMIVANYLDEAKQLANKYLEANIVGKSSLTSIMQ